MASCQGVRIAERLLTAIRYGSLKGYVEVVDTNLVRSLTNVPPTCIRQPMPYDGRQPRHEGARRIVGRSHGVDRQEDLLHDVFNNAFAEEPSPCPHELPDPRRNRP